MIAVDNKRLNKFLKLKCAGDVLNSLAHLSNPIEEIVLSMTLLDEVRSKILRHPDRYTLVDVAAGNGVVTVLAAYLLPVKEAIAVNSKVRKTPVNVRKFKMIEADIAKDAFWESLPQPYICLASYPQYAHVTDAQIEVSAADVILAKSNADLTIVVPRTIVPITKDQKNGPYYPYYYSNLNLAAKHGGRVKYIPIGSYSNALVRVGVK